MNIDLITEKNKQLVLRNVFPKMRWVWILLIVIGSTHPAFAYVGPGAGFAIASTFFTLLVAVGIAFLTLLTWPIKFLIKMILRIKRTAKSRVKRVVVVGLDGQDPELTEEWMAQGLLPNFSKLREQGGFYRLGTSLPAESPVAWSSFQTGCNPGKHRIFDFLVPNRKSLLPELSSAAISTSPKTIKLGKYRIPIGKARFKVGRKSQPFWKVLGDYGVFSSIIRVPITFPPEKFRGVLLSAMCVPDLKGSQGTFFYYTSNSKEEPELSSGMQLPLNLDKGIASGIFSGPENQTQGDGDIEIPFKVHVQQADKPELVIGKERYTLVKGTYTPWIPLDFRPGLGQKVRGRCRVMILETTPHVRMYVTPIQIDPEKPAFPISYPAPYSIYLAKKQGPYATLGVAEDTSGLNEHIIDEQAFLDQCYSIHEEREEMFFDALEKTPRGSVVCVFDITDRIQHMFFRPFEAAKEKGDKQDKDTKYSHIIPDLYKQMDDLVGRVMAKMDKDTVLMVMSDHGFKPFRREVNLNTWLKENGYLTIKESCEDADLLQAIDWSQTQAYSVGFGGIYLNMIGRERLGIVESGKPAEALKSEISKKLLALRDDQENPIKRVYDTRIAYSGPYVKDAPDLIAGFRVGYRAAWSAVTGALDGQVIQDNTKPWSGDHNMNPPDVPGMLFCNQAIAKDDPHLEDIGPTVLDLFGVPVPKYCDGESFLPAKQKNMKESKK